VLIEAKDDGSGGDSWSYKSCKAPVKSTPPTNQHPVFYRPDALPVAQPQRRVENSLSVLTAIFQVNPGYPVFIEAMDDGGGGDNWSCKSCKAPVDSSPPTIQHPGHSVSKKSIRLHRVET